MSRISLKVTGAQGQGVNSVGEICGKGLKRAGYCVFGYREYMSLIKGGHSSYQLDASHEKIESSETRCDIVVNFNHHGLEQNYADVKDGGILIHQTPEWKFPKEHQKLLDNRNVTVVYLPTEDILKKLKFPPILGNVLITSVVWSLLGQNDEGLKELVREQFGHKGEELVKKNFMCVDEGIAFAKDCAAAAVVLPDADPSWKDHLFMTGSEAMGLGIVHAGCRMYVGYPMTPSSPLLSYLAEIQNDTGMVIKQAEDEITAAQMMTGGMLMGTRAATGTSGGGFDLMTETVSLNGIIENPAVFVLAQRPGPATGLPTWTGQGDLLLAVNSAHGDFARLVMSVSEAQDAFDLMPEAFNYADVFQTPVIVLTDKHIAEALYTQAPFDEKKATIDRGNLVTDPKKLAKLKAHDRFDSSAKDGISPRWLPGSKAEPYCAQGDEHDGAGNVDEGAENAVQQMEKRMRKMDALKTALPEPQLLRVAGCELREGIDTLIVSWGSNKGVILDAIEGMEGVAYLHYSYLWPLKTELLEELAAKAKKMILIEQNYQGQLGMLIKQECGLEFDQKILKYDGRPFFFDELQASLTA
ncbi:MAG: 2-oxoacid:acceptor oxidoreductase subunit alpha [bacterium]|nr:2-oxoacid:acceptor oxidoreductase subunit alpha [bacterium]